MNEKYKNLTDKEVGELLSYADPVYLEILKVRASVALTEVGLRCCRECRELFGFAAEAEVLPF